ncbi:histone-lysine N-methyltransferase SETMAR [Trichonephila clavipes]|uniref:Histone-lysine N-methyltransferase SETMAR n=1 Tax=Trichonephila clavipes TaxID=2585209 RepID=A0A8X6SCZ8_TRICX|nr:histone-lysine N-methyltransferase SETMAR [Trichonephila clavipes]
MIQHVKRKRPLLQNSFLLHHDDARPHIARCVLEISQQNNVEILPHPPYSPDLTPCDFWFSQLKKPLRGKRFASNKVCVKAAEVILKSSHKTDFYMSLRSGQNFGIHTLRSTEVILKKPMKATAGSDVVQSGRPIFDDFFQHLWPYIGNNTANVVFQMVKRLWLIRIDQ